MNDITDDIVVDMVDVSWHLWVTASPTYVEHLEGPLLVAPSKLHAAAAAKRHVPRAHYADRDARRKLLDTDAGNVCRLDGASKGSEQGCFAGPWRHIADCAFALTKRHAKNLGFFRCSASGVWRKLDPHIDVFISLQRARAKTFLRTACFD